MDETSGMARRMRHRGGAGKPALPRRARSAAIVARAAPRITICLGGSLLAIGALDVAVTSARDATARGARAHVAKTVSVRDRSELHLVRADGETLIEEGSATGTLSGTAKIRLYIDTAAGTARASFTLYLHDGTLSGQSSGKANGGHGGWESFSGTMRLTHGTRRYAHASGSGNMYGAIFRRTDKLIVQEYGRLRY
jgi:hypothetical protein